MNTTARTQKVTESPTYPSASFAIPEEGASYYPVPPLENVIPKTYLPPHTPMPIGEVYTDSCMHSPTILSLPIIQVEVSLATLLAQFPPVQNAKEMKEQERKRVESMMQPERDNTQHKVSLIEKRLMVDRLCIKVADLELVRPTLSRS